MDGNNTGQKKVSILDKLFSVFVIVSFSAMIVLVFLNAILRYIFNSGISQSEELARYFFMWSCFLGAIVAMRDSGHVGVDMLLNKLSSVPRSVMLLVVDFLELGATLIFTYGGVLYLKSVIGVYSPATHLPQPLIAAAISVCGFAFLMIIIRNIIKHIKGWGTK